MGIGTIVTMLGVGFGTTIVSVVLEASGRGSQAKLTEVLGISIMGGTAVSAVASLAKKLSSL
ncbi:putative membrane protein (plasmid) [Clostridium baratii str. Sullivan]|uniref:Putative membrane protein n=1 Tax=Clostridium baratii str. Sullivan TaxID=1415775 RepID=A0A0A7G052_9CLOT|nr:SpoIIIAC/SpoIIIAD family protein [Clostridium baratii]AIY85233.1 putative membrane protein [Clostridium baratii str. Sullivan]